MGAEAAASTVRKQGERKGGDQLAFSDLLNLGPSLRNGVAHLMLC